MSQAAAKMLLDKIRDLPPEKVAEVEDFVEFLRRQATGRSLTSAASRWSEGSFERIWNNPDDADYDTL